MPKKQHKVLVFAGPSGSGKTTIVRKIMEQFPNITFAVSACTRSKRPNEAHQKDYYYFSHHQFMSKVAQGAFVEFEEVYNGLYYGTLKEEIDRLWALGKTVMFDVDIKGAIKLKEYFDDQALAVFVKVSGPDLLSERLRRRNTERAEIRALRIEKAHYEVSFIEKFDTILINDDLEVSVPKAFTLVRDFLAR